MYTFEIELTPEERVQANQLNTRFVFMPGIRTRARISITLTFLLTWAVSTLLARAWWWSGWLFAVGNGFLVTVMTALALMFNALLINRLWRRQLFAHMKNRYADAGPMRCTFDAEGIRIESKTVDSNILWAGVHGIYANAMLTLIDVAGGCVLPHRVFADDAQRLAFQAFCHEQISVEAGDRSTGISAPPPTG
jgi:hypothetical protein